MSMTLPKPIADYVNANARLDLEGMLEPFAADAVILDVGKRFEGDGIRHLFEKEVLPVKAIFTPDTLHQDGEQIVVEGPAHGSFPGSPIRFTYRFKLEGNKIEQLEITA